MTRPDFLQGNPFSDTGPSAGAGLAPLFDFLKNSGRKLFRISIFQILDLRQGAGVDYRHHCFKGLKICVNNRTSVMGNYGPPISGRILEVGET